MQYFASVATKKAKDNKEFENYYGLDYDGFDISFFLETDKDVMDVDFNELHPVHQQQKQKLMEQ